MSTISVPLALDDPVNTAILAVSEDTLEAFQRDPFGEIAVIHDLHRHAQPTRTARRTRSTRPLNGYFPFSFGIFATIALMQTTAACARSHLACGESAR